MKTPILISLVALSVSACASFRFDEVADTSGAPLSASVRNSYTVLGSGDIVPRRCVWGQRSELTEVPLGCTVDTVMGSQVSDQRDLIRPVEPGLASIASTNIRGTDDENGGNLAPENAQPQ